MSISVNRIQTKDEIRSKLETWFKYRPEEDYDFRLNTSYDTFEVVTERVTRFQKMEE